MRVVDMHCDTISRLLEEKENGDRRLRENTGHLDLLRMKGQHYLLQNFALFVNKERDGDPWERVCRLEAYYREELARNSDLIAPVLSYADIEANEAAGKMSALLTVEEGAVCKGEPEKLRILYEKGVRMLTLTWNYPNELGYPNLKREKRKESVHAYLCTPETEMGLTALGREFVEEMERLGMIPDVSHLSDAGFYDVLETTHKPFVASHSDARAVCPCARNMTDDMIRRLGERGGCMGLNFCTDFLELLPEGKENPGTMEAAVRHALHIVKTGGIEVLGLGSDFDGISTNEALPGAQSMERLWDALHREGFTEGQLEKIFWKNVLRVYRDCL